MLPRPTTITRKKVGIRRIADGRRLEPLPLLAASDVDDLLDSFGVQDAELVVMNVSIEEDDDGAPPRSGVRPASVPEEEIEELVDGITDGWD